MQKNQPTARLSFEENPMYKRGYQAGFEAGQRATNEKGTQPQQTIRSNGQPFTSGIGSRRSQSQDNKDLKGFRKSDKTITEQRPIQGNKPIKTSRLSNEFPSRKLIDEPTVTRDVNIEEHEMEGKVSNPETEVQINTRGHF